MGYCSCVQSYPDLSFGHCKGGSRTKVQIKILMYILPTFWLFYFQHVFSSPIVVATNMCRALNFYKCCKPSEDVSTHPINSCRWSTLSKEQYLINPQDASHALVPMLLDMNIMFYILVCGEVCACRVKAQVKL